MKFDLHYESLHNDAVDQLKKPLIVMEASRVSQILKAEQSYTQTRLYFPAAAEIARLTEKDVDCSVQRSRAFGAAGQLVDLADALNVHPELLSPGARVYISRVCKMALFDFDMQSTLVGALENWDEALAASFKLLGQIVQRLADYDQQFYADRRARIKSGTLYPEQLRADLESHLDSQSLSEGHEYVAGILGQVPHRLPTQALVGLSAEMHGFGPTAPCLLPKIVDLAQIDSNTVLYDLGAGNGATGILFSLLSRAEVRLVDIQPSLHCLALQTIDGNNIKNVRAIQSDARLLDYSDGNCFYLFNPFSGRVLRDVLQRLGSVAAIKPIRIIMHYMPNVELPFPGRRIVEEPHLQIIFAGPDQD